MCWAIGEHGGGGDSHKDAARELFESLELLLYENLSFRYELLSLFLFALVILYLLHGADSHVLVPLGSRLGLRQESALGSDSETSRKSSQSRLLCFVVTAIAKLATHHRELLPRARVSLGKVCLEMEGRSI